PAVPSVMRSRNPSYARTLKFGSSSVSYFTSKSSVTYSALAGTLNDGLNSRSKRVLRVGGPAVPSFAFVWNAAFEPMNVADVVHGTVFWLAVPPCAVDHPAGRVPGAT